LSACAIAIVLFSNLAGCAAQNAADQVLGAAVAPVIIPTRPILVASYSLSSFPGTIVTTTSTITATIQNSGASSAAVSLAVLSGATPMSITTDGCSFTTLAAGQSCSLTFSFAPTIAASYTAQFTLPYNATNGGVVYTTTASFSGTSILPQPLISSSPASFDFGTISVGSTSTKTFIISNAATATGTFQPATLSGSGYTITNDSCNTLVLAAGTATTSCTVTVQLSPSVAGPALGQLTLNYRDSVGTNLNTYVTLAGIGNTPVAVLSIVSGNQQSTAPGVTFTNALRVQLLLSGSPLVGQSVNFAVMSGPSVTFSAASGNTDGSGMVQTFVTAGVASGTVTIRATYLSSTTDFTLTVVNQSTAILSLISGNAQTANVGTTLALPFIVETRDSVTSAPLSNILVRFTVASSNGRINSSTSTTVVSSDGVGRASVTFEVGTLAGANSVTATIVSVPAQTVSFGSTGIVPTNSAVDLAQSAVTRSVPTLVADGSQTATLTLTTRDIYGNVIPAGGKSVAFSVNTGALVGSVTDVGNGTYTQVVRAPATTTPPTLSATGSVNAAALTSTAATISLLSGTVSLALSTITSTANAITANGTATTLITLTIRDSLGNPASSGGQTVVFASTLGALLGSVTDVGDGTYTQTLKSGTVAASAVVSATIGGGAVTTTKTITFSAGPPDATQSTLSATPSTLAPNGSSTTTISAQLRDANGNFCAAAAAGRTVTLTRTTGTWQGSGLTTITATDNGDGTYSKTLVAPVTAGTSTITAVDNGTTLTRTATVYFSGGSTGPNAATSLVSIIGVNPIAADGASTVTVKVTLRDSFSTQLGTGGSTVTIATTAGTLLGSVTDVGDGTYTQSLRAPVSGAIATVSATVNSQSIAQTANESFYGAMSLSQSTLSASPGSIVANGASTTVLFLNAKDANGVAIPVGGVAGLALSTNAGTLLGSLTDNANGTYSQQLRSAASASTATVSATKSAVPFSNTASIDFYALNNRAGLTIDCLNIATYQNTTILVDAGTLTMNSRGVNGTCPSSFVFNGVVLQNGATLTHTAATLTQEYGLTLSANYVTIDATSSLNVTGKGYPASGAVKSYRTQGNQDIFTGAWNADGASYGGSGAWGGTATNSTYGSLYEPSDLGSSGQNTGGAGGGRLKLTVTGVAGISNLGSIRSDGINPGNGNGGGGSGGSIWISTTAISGTGSITANGGDSTLVNFAGPQYGGGGGRIAVYYTSGGLSGNFAYPLTLLGNILTKGGMSNPGCAAGAGTVYLKSSTQSYGDLIMDNRGNTACASTIGTPLLSPSIPANEAVTATTLMKTNAFKDVYSTTSPYKFWFVDPKISQNGTPKKADNLMYQITSATADVITTAGDMTTVAATGDTGELVLIFDNVEIGDKTPVSAGNLRILSYGGDLRSNDATSVVLTNALPPKGMEYIGAQSINFNLTGRSLPAFLNEDFGSATLTVSNGTITFGSLSLGSFVANAATVNGNKLRTTGNVSFNTVTSTFTQTVGNYAIQSDGTIDFAGTNTINQAATTASTEYSLEMLGSSISLSAGTTLNALGRGFVPQTAGFVSRVFGNQDTVLNYAGGGLGNSGGSHGGRGANGPGPEGYGSIFNPYTSGGSGVTTSNGYAGGGIIRLSTVSAGPITINGLVDARGNGAGGSNYAGAGGSIYLNGGVVSGAGIIDASGGPSGNYGAGGGRIAVYYTSLGGNFTYPTNALSNIRAYGSLGLNLSYSGGAGTVFLKSNTDTYGKLLVNNNNVAFSDTSGRHTAINFPTNAASTSLTYNAGTGLSTLTLTNGFAEKYGASGSLVGMYLNPNTAQNGTARIQDDTLFKITAQTSNTLTVLGNATTVGAAGNTFKVNMKLDDLRVVGNAVLEINNGVVQTADLTVTNGGIYGTGSIESYPTLATTLNANGSTVNLNYVGPLSTLTLQNGTYVFPANTTVSMLGDLTLSSATLSGANLGFIVNGNLSATSTTAASVGSVTTTGNLSMSGSTFTGTGQPYAIGGAMSMSTSSATAVGNLTVGTTLLVNSSSTLTQAVTATTNITGNATVSTSSALNANNVTVGGNLLVDSASTMNSGARVLTPFTTYNTVSNINVTGSTTISNGSTLTHPPSTTTEEYYLFVTSPNFTLDPTSFINVDGRGYSNVTLNTYRGIGNADTAGYNGLTPTGNTGAGASYGGAGGAAGGHYSNKPYGTYFSPIYLGTSGSCNTAAGGCAVQGGGAVRLNTSGTAQIDGVITAYGIYAGGNNGGSGGSIYMQAGTLAGSGTIRANGPVGGVYGAGGGRIAVYYTNLSGGFATNATLISNLQTYGGFPGGSTTTRGSSGTVYLKQASQTYGDLIINNNGVDSAILTPLGAAAVTVSSSLTTTSLTGTLAFANVYGNLPDFFKGLYFNPNTAQNGTNKLSDDTVFLISGNNSTTINTATSGVTAVAGAGNAFVLQAIFDNLEVSGKGKIGFAGQNIRVLSGDLSSNDSVTFSQDGGITARTVDVGPGTTWNNTGNASGAITTKCAFNFACP
jgi:hypothetical protein